MDDLLASIPPKKLSKLSPEKERLIRLRLATQKLIHFTQLTLPSYQPAPHHELIADKLEQVEQGKLTRLMIFMPPRHGKSELASRRFIAWYLGRNPNKHIIACSYNSDLADDFGREVRNIIADPLFSQLFPTALRKDSKAANRWHTDQGGAYVAAGVGTAVTGRGADILVIDDPLKDREEADSETIRNKVWDWYTSTAYTRLMPKGSVILIQTRWHDDDLAGRLIEKMEKEEGDQWEILNLPAINEAGEALWPEWFPREVLDQTKKVIGDRDWNALYQQNPMPEEGDFFKRAWFKWYDPKETPKDLKKYGASDYAVTSDGGDFTEHGVFGVDRNDDLYILDWWYGQEQTDIWIENLIRMNREHRILAWAEENGQIIKSVGPFINKRQMESGVYFYRKQYTSAADKPTRAQSFRGRAAQGKVYLPKNTDWAERLLHQLTRFPAGKYDDAVDVCSLMGRMLAELIKPMLPKPKRKIKFPTELSMNELIKYHAKLKRRTRSWE